MNGQNENEREERLKALLSESYTSGTSGEPGDALGRRVGQMAARRDAQSTSAAGAVRRWFLRPARVAWAMMLLLVTGGTFTWYLMQRHGELAVRMIPADALLVVTLDTTPSKEQLGVFNRIHQALGREGLETKVDEAVGELVDKSPIARDLRPHLRTSMAFAMIGGRKPGDLDSASPVVFLSIKDRGQVEAILSRTGQARNIQGLRYYRFKRDDQCGAIIGDYLVLSQQPALLARVSETSNDRVPSVAGLREYQTARADLPEDAIVMVFVSPTALAAAEQTGKAMGVNPLRATRWMSISATLRDAGIKFDYRMPMDASRAPELRMLAQIAPIDGAAYRKLPAGAYGVIGFSQPGRYWEYVRDSAGQAGERKEMDRGLADFEKETGLSVPRDILPALQGDLWLAGYPDGDGPESGIDGLIVIDDAHGADPAALAAKLRAMLDKPDLMGKDNRVRFNTRRQGDATEWELDSKVASNLRKGMSDTVSSTSDLTGQGSTSHGQPHDTDKYLRDKTIVHVQIGKAVLIASSQAMLDRAILAYTGRAPTLAEDPAFSNMREAIGPNMQNVFLVNLSKIMERLRPILSKGLKDSGVDPEDVIRLFGGADSGLAIGGRYDGELTTGSFFLPLEYERAIRLLSKAASHAKDAIKDAAPDLKFTLNAD